MQLVAAGTKERGLTIVAIAKDMIVVEDKFSIVKEIDNERRICNCQKARRLTSGVYMLPPCVERRSNDGASLPFERLFMTSAADDGFTFAAQDVHFFFSSRRRHTSSLCDWSSDVCSSD